MSHRASITRGMGILLGMSVFLAGVAFTLPRLHPVPTGLDAELTALRSERDRLALNSDYTLANLRRQTKQVAPVTWSLEKFAEEVGTGWRVEWKRPDGHSRSVLLSRSVPRLHDWPEYVRFVHGWTAQPGIVLESLDVTAKGSAQAREFTQVVIGLRVSLDDRSMSDAERVTPSRGPLPVVPATGPAMPRKIGPGPPLRPPAPSAETPAVGPFSTSSRPDPPGPWAGVHQTITPINPNPT